MEQQHTKTNYFAPIPGASVIINSVMPIDQALQLQG
jgi:hypothetical protein